MWVRAFLVASLGRNHTAEKTGPGLASWKQSHQALGHRDCPHCLVLGAGVSRAGTEWPRA